MSCLYWNKARNRYYIVYRRAGRYVSKSLKTADRKIAKHLQAQVDLELGKIDAGMAESLCHFGKAADRFLAERRTMVAKSSMTRYEQMFYSLWKFLKGHDIEHMQRITSEVVRQYVQHRRDEGSSPKTCKEELRLLKTMISWLIERGDLQKNPVLSWPKLKTPAVRPETIGGYSSEEIERILKWFEGSPAEGPVWVLAFSGARLDEGRTIRKHQVDLATGILRLRQGKTETNSENMFRSVEIHPRLLPVLKAAMAGKAHDDLLFPVWSSHQTAWVTQLLETCCRQLGIQYRRAHGLRHSWISRLAESGVPLPILMRLAGHKNLSTTQKYLHMGDRAKGWVTRL